MADGKRVELYKQRQLIEEQLEKCKEEREHARKRREREKQARKLREEAFDMKLQWTMDRQLRRKTKSSDTSLGDSLSNNEDDSSDDNPSVSRLILPQRNQEPLHPVLPQQQRNVRRSKRPLTIGEETGQKEQPISDGSDFVSGYSDDSDHLSQGDDNGLVAEVQSLRQQLAAVNTERNQLLSASQELPSVTLDGRQVANSQPHYRQPFPRSLSTQSTKSEAIQNLFVEIDRLGQETNHLKQQLHCKAVECDDLLQLLEESEAKLLASQVENKELQSDLLRLENENYSLSKGQSCAGNYSNSLWNKKAVGELESRLGLLQQQLDHVIKERDQMSKEKNHITKERDRVIRDLDKMNKEKHQIITERDKAYREWDHVISQRDVIAKGKDQMIKERDQVIKERDQVIKERDQVTKERNQVIKDRDQVIIEKDHFAIEKDQVICAMDHVMKDKEQIVGVMNDLAKERDQVITERDQVINERDQVMKERDQLFVEKDQLIVDRDKAIREKHQLIKANDQVTNERDKLIKENDRWNKERNQVIDERDKLIKENDWLIKERDQVTDERDKLIKENDRLIKERDQVTDERDKLIKENDRLIKERDQVTDERDKLIKENDRVIRERDQVISEKGQVIQDRDYIITERDQLLRDNDEATIERDQLMKERDEVNTIKVQLDETVESLTQQLDHVMHENLVAKGKFETVNEANVVISNQLVTAQHKFDLDLEQCNQKLDHVIQQRDHVIQLLDDISKVGLSQLRDDMITIENLLLHFKKNGLSGVTAMNDKIMSQYRVQVDSLMKLYSSKERKLIYEHQLEVCRLNQLLDSKGRELQQARREDLLQMERSELNSFEASMWQRQCRKQSVQSAKMNVSRLQTIEQYQQQLNSQSEAIEILANTKKKLELANEELVTKEQQLESFRQQLKDREKQLELSSKELSDVYQVSTKKSEELLEFKKRVFCCEQDKLQLISELSSLRVSRGSNLKLLEAQVQHLVSERDSLKSQLTSLREQVQSRVVAMESPCGNHSEALQEKIVQLQGRVEARDEVLEELQREMKEKELANFCVVAKLKSINFDLGSQLESAKAGIAAKESRLREVEDRLAVAEQQLSTPSTTGDSKVVRPRSMVAELTHQGQHDCSCCSNLSQSVVISQLHDEPYTSRRPKYALLPRQPTTSWPRNSLLRSQFSINLPGQSDQSIDLLDNTSGDQYRLGPVVVTDDDQSHGQLERVKHRYRTHRRVQSCDSSLSACLPSPATSQPAAAIEVPSSGEVVNKTRPKSAESSQHQPLKSPVGSCDLPVTPLVASEGRGSVTPLVSTPVASSEVNTQSTTATTVTNTMASSTVTSSSEQRKFRLLKRIIGFKATGESSKGKRSLGPVITISVPTAATIANDKEAGVKRSESITSNDTSFTTGSISPSLDGCENFSKIERHESFASYGGGVSRTSSIVSRDFLLATPKVSSCFKPIAPDEESSSEEDWEKPYLVTASQHDLDTWKRKNQSMIDMAAAASMGLYNDNSKTGGMQFSIRLLPQQRSYSSDTINLDTMEASESEEEHERLRNVNELMRRKGRLHCRYSSTGSLVKIYCASDTSMEDIRSFQQ